MTPWIEPDDDDEYTGDEPQSNSPGARRTDPWTSHAAAKSIEPTAKNQRGKLLHAYATSDAWRAEGLTDEEAQEISGVSRLSGFWKRCSELRQGGYIEPTGKTRKSHAGVDCIVCRITDKGTAALNKIRSEEF